MYLTSTYFYNHENYSEVANISKRVSDLTLKRSNVILDLAEKKVVKCRHYLMNNVEAINPTYGELLEHFQKLYPNELAGLQA